MTQKELHECLTRTFGFNNFGRNKDLSVEHLEDIYLAVSAAYRDMSVRTISGFAAVEEYKKTAIRLWLTRKLYDYFEEPVEDEKGFDDCHKLLCEEFVATLKDFIKPDGEERDNADTKKLDGIEEKITAGKAQKIINMAFKNLYCFSVPAKTDDDKLMDYYRYRHMALDSNILDWFWTDVITWYENTHERVPRSYRKSWSNLEYGDKDKNEKGSYLWIQTKIREYIDAVQKGETQLNWMKDENDKLIECDPFVPFTAEFFLWAKLIAKQDLPQTIFDGLKKCPADGKSILKLVSPCSEKQAQ